MKSGKAETLSTENSRLRSEIESLKTLIAKRDLVHEREIDRLKEIILGLQRKAFGPRKERWESSEQGVLGFFNEAEKEAGKPEADEDGDDAAGEEVNVRSFTRKRGKRRPLPEHLPREVVQVELPEQERFTEDGRSLRVIGKEISEKLVYEPATMRVIEYHRFRYGVDSGETIKTAPPVPSIIPKGIATSSLVAAIVTAKYADGLPLYRQEEILTRQNVDIHRCTMARWIIQASETCMPIWNILQDRLMASSYVSCDETHTQVLKEKNRRAESKSWMWVRTTPTDEQKIALFDYDPYRSGVVAKRLLSDYRGFLQVDGLGVYNVLEKQEGIVRIGCNMHGRRGFEKALKEGAKCGRSLAERAMNYYQQLYAVEERGRSMTWPERFALRNGEARPIWDEMKKWAEENASKVPPKSRIGEAFHYFISEYEYLTGYLRDGRLEIDNGFAERAIRKFAIGRNNWLFADTEAGANASAMFYSFVVTAKINGLNPYAALKEIFEKIPLAKTIDDYELLANRLLSSGKMAL